MDNNPWTCSCDNAWLGVWLKRWHLETASARHHSANQVALSSVTCRDPITLRKRYLVDLASTEGCSHAAGITNNVSSRTFGGSWRSVFALLYMACFTFYQTNGFL